MRPISDIARERFEADRRVKEAARKRKREAAPRITHREEIALYARINSCNRRARRNYMFTRLWLALHEIHLMETEGVEFSTEYRPTEWPEITEGDAQ